MNVNRFLLPVLLATLYLGNTAEAQTTMTLRRANESVLQASQSIIDSFERESLGWGESTALEDLYRLHCSAALLTRLMSETNASRLLGAQRELKVAANRLSSTQQYFPSEVQTRVAILLQRAAMIDSRITRLRTQFQGKAAALATPVGDVELEVSRTPFDVYADPAALLRDVRTLGHQSRDFQNETWPNYSGGGSPNYEPDSYHIQEYILSVRDLEDFLSNDYRDIREALPLWKEVRRHYDRLGLTPRTPSSRRVTEGIERLASFFERL